MSMRKSGNITRALVTAVVLTFSGLASAAVNSGDLGAQYSVDGSILKFRVRSTPATRVEVWLFSSATGQASPLHQKMNQEAGGIWSASVPVAALQSAGITGTVYYGYRAWGPNWPYSTAWTAGSGAGFLADVDVDGNRFNPNKLLLDPYAREISHDPVTPAQPDGTVYGSGAENRNRDSELMAPKGIVLNPDSTATGTKPERALRDDVIYEVSLRGLTMNDSSVPENERGTYRGAAQKADYLASLGVTAVEFLPLQEFPDDQNDITPRDTSSTNYWGYGALNYFSPDRRNAADKSPGGPTREFKEMVRAFHDKGIKVIVDVVYNHTGEGSAWHSSDTSTYTIISYRGLDNAAYYELSDDRQSYVDNTDTGANYNTHNPVAQDLIVDSLAYWRDKLGVDGFRFDLAPVLGNTCETGCFNYDKTDPSVAVNRILKEFGSRPENGGAGTDWIAEPWATGGNSYQLGGFPSGWSEWNGRFRDDIRTSQNMQGRQSVNLWQTATRLAGSPDVYQEAGRKTASAINYVDIHDGFTLADLYRCNSKNNTQPWPYGPSPGGSDSNLSWDQGGQAADQRRAARNGFALTVLAAGVPMMAGGDEMLRSLQCNNNPYNLDSDANWLNWSLTAEQQNFREFVRGLLAFRKAHPALRPADWNTHVGDTGGTDTLQWFTPAGSRAGLAFLNDTDNQSLGWRISTQGTGDSDTAIYVAYNASADGVNFTLPDVPAGSRWYRVTDTCNSHEGPAQVAQPGQEVDVGAAGSGYSLCGRGLALFTGR